MAKVKIQGHASGTGVLTVTAPNTSTDRTITLPDGTGTLIADDGSGNVGIGVTPESWQSTWKMLQIADGASIGGRTNSGNMELCSNAYRDSVDSQWEYIGANGSEEAAKYTQFEGGHTFYIAPSGSADAAITWTTALEIANDGRGLSQFTAKAWMNLDGTGTPSFRDSHNCSSVTDVATGNTQINYTNAMADANYSIAIGAQDQTTRTNVHSSIDAQATTYHQIWHYEAGSLVDCQRVCSIVFGD